MSKTTEIEYSGRGKGFVEAWEGLKADVDRCMAEHPTAKFTTVRIGKSMTFDDKTYHWVVRAEEKR